MVATIFAFSVAHTFVAVLLGHDDLRPWLQMTHKTHIHIYKHQNARNETKERKKKIHGHVVTKAGGVRVNMVVVRGGGRSSFCSLSPSVLGFTLCFFVFSFFFPLFGIVQIPPSHTHIYIPAQRSTIAIYNTHGAEKKEKRAILENHRNRKTRLSQLESPLFIISRVTVVLLYSIVLGSQSSFPPPALSLSCLKVCTYTEPLGIEIHLSSSRCSEQFTFL